jgi:protein-S-isoprenylcysteine O-methyltransferase Ste14
MSAGVSFGDRRAAHGASIPPLLARIGAEERLLHMQFAGEYDGYRTSRG